MRDLKQLYTTAALTSAITLTTMLAGCNVDEQKRTKETGSSIHTSARVYEPCPEDSGYFHQDFECLLQPDTTYIDPVRTYHRDFERQ